MRVLNFLGRLSQQGGVQIVMRNLLSGLDTRYIDSHVCTIRPYRRDEAVHVLGMHQWHSFEHSGTYPIHARWKIIRQLRALVLELKPDVVHAHSGLAWYAMAALLGTGVPGIIEVHDAPSSGRVSWLNNQVEAMGVRRLGWQPVVHSTQVLDDFSSFARVQHHHIELLPLGIDTQRFKSIHCNREDWCQANVVPDTSKLVFYATRLVPSKNLALFLEVARRTLGQNADIDFVVAGAGPLKEDLIQRARSMGIADRVHFIGPRYGQELVDAYHACDIYLSTSDYEGFGLTAVEAMAAGKPVVATGVGGIVDIVQADVTGYLTPAGDAAGLTDGLLRLINDPGKAQQMGQRGLERAVERFDVQNMVAGFESLYRRVAAKTI